jgi:outer membrane protein assembly factor BamD (BamD/ComL family)
MRFVKIPALLLMAVAAYAILPLALAQESRQVTREQAQAVLGRVSQDVWHAQMSSTGYGRVQELYTEGERAYFKGDYAEAVKKLNMADSIVRGLPNDYGMNP